MAESNQSILERSIEKAIDNGWDVLSTGNHQIDVVLITLDMLDDPEHYHNDAPHPGLTVYIRRNGYYAPNEVIYNHEFAEALWGDRIRDDWYDDSTTVHPFMGGSLEYPYNEGAGMTYRVAEWQYHLQNMVIAKDPIKYLGENI